MTGRWSPTVSLVLLAFVAVGAITLMQDLDGVWILVVALPLLVYAVLRTIPAPRWIGAIALVWGSDRDSRVRAPRRGLALGAPDQLETGPARQPRPRRPPHRRGRLAVSAPVVGPPHAAASARMDRRDRPHPGAGAALRILVRGLGERGRAVAGAEGLGGLSAGRHRPDRRDGETRRARAAVRLEHQHLARPGGRRGPHSLGCGRSATARASRRRGPRSPVDGRRRPGAPRTGGGPAGGSGRWGRDRAMAWSGRQGHVDLHAHVCPAAHRRRHPAEVLERRACRASARHEERESAVARRSRRLPDGS